MIYKCIICSNKQNIIFRYSEFDYYKCSKCGLVSTYPLPTKLDIKNHYKNEFKNGNYKFLRQYSSQYNKIYLGFLKEIKKYLKNEDRSLNGLKILDVGCFTGEFLSLASKEGADVYGIELQKDAVEIAKNKIGGKVINQDVSKNPFGSQKFDIITMFGLIEHVENPKPLIKNASRMLKADGIIVLQTPNSGSIIAKMTKKYWPPYTPIEHIHLFSKKSLSMLLKLNGFEIVFFKNHFKVLPIAYVYNMLNVFGPEIKNFLRKFETFYDPNKSNVSLPFYVGEMYIIARKK